ncbi:unnamed protein product [Cylindrotheca closterium]|uniref:Alcohol dehydrogenase-like C-terminal domain-containing protein n=1 Tax=Cylindrotheca closterium TaxID=2856 RepID=A0AAD2JK60_9STRA|nr:unnamed protein product [Cylindrotheca closterium]
MHKPSSYLFIAAILCLLRPSEASSSHRPIAFLLDVDNTLYDELDSGIESQIVKNTHSYCKERFGMEKEEADDLFRQFGSTMEGLKQTILKGKLESEVHEALDDFYATVYKKIDYSSLLLESTAQESSTGYSMTRDRKQLRQLLRFCPHPIWISSNSPSWHVRRTLEAMGLADIHFERCFTPDRLPFYPTKHDPIRFFGEYCEELLSYARLIVFDDSSWNLSRICENFPRAEGVLVSRRNPLTTAWLRTVLLDPEFKFDQVQYLDSKNAVDRKSINSNIWNEVVASLQGLRKREVHIADVGAGILSMLDLFLHGDVSKGLNPLLIDTKGPYFVHYTAYESNAKLYEACHQKLLSWGLTAREKSENVIIYEGPSVRVRLILEDFDRSPPIPTPDLIVGCCFADLFDPSQLVPSLIRSFSLLDCQRTILYFPITFEGITQLFPPQPFESTIDGTIPSDTAALGVYSEALSRDLGHNLDPALLQDEMERHGFSLQRKGGSMWNIHHDVNPYLYMCMLYFFGSAAGPKLQHNGFDAQGWIQRIRKTNPHIQVSNVDLMFRVGKNLDHCLHNTESDLVMEEIYFVGTRDVITRKKRIPELLPTQVLRTELKIFNGQFDDAVLDATIEDMKDERMAYPLSYGYCLVGHVIQCGDAVPNDLIGKLVFSFSPHASHVVTNFDNIHVVPDNISPEDAIFMPSVETALSLIHDASPRMGENVAVFGQGLIGLLVTAILGTQRQTSNSAKFGVVTAFETIPTRLMAAARFGASQALLPGSFSGPFDVSIEVSGNFKALQSAIDLTADGGRIIVGSWYGNSAVNLNLGIEFHRSQKTIRASQVSKIPLQLQSTWNKDRRFEFTWELVRNLKPSRMLSRVTDINGGKTAYEALDRGEEIAIAFKY